MSDVDDRYLTAAQVRARYGGVSDMWIWRRMNDASGFPRPLMLGGRRFWKLSDLVNWERSQAGNSTRSFASTTAAERKVSEAAA